MDLKGKVGPDGLVDAYDTEIKKWVKRPAVDVRECVKAGTMSLDGPDDAPRQASLPAETLETFPFEELTLAQAREAAALANISVPPKMKLEDIIEKLKEAKFIPPGVIFDAKK